MKEGAEGAVKFELHSQKGADFQLGKGPQKGILGKPEMDTLSKAQTTVSRRWAAGQEMGAKEGEVC